MLPPYVANAIGQLRYQELLEEAEAERRYRQQAVKLAKSLKRVNFRLSQVLIVAGQKLAGQTN